MKIGNLNLIDFGNTVLLAGGIFSDQENNLHAIVLPGVEETEIGFIAPTHDEWKELVRQTDLKVVEVTQGEKLPKAIVRKCERSIENRIKWKVFKRDRYRCRYCGNDDTPLTVDHLVLWEDLGPSTEENLVSCCSKCNKMRGNTKYEEWLNSDKYKIRSKDLLETVDELNRDLIPTLKDIPLRPAVKSR
jgi:hypothetical protein